MSLIRRLPAGPLDIVGDVHGELEALHELLAQLGYDKEGRHAQGRRLVFLGDLCDRGPDSPGVFSLVRRIVEGGHGDCILGNHELNLLKLAPKLGNGWFFAEAEDHDLKQGHFRHSRRLPQEQRAALLQFMHGLPLVLERDDIRVVHACWDAASVEALRSRGEDDVLRVYRDSEAAFQRSLSGTAFGASVEAEDAVFEQTAADPNQPPPASPNLARRDELYQNANPVRVLTSGKEQLAAEPFFSSGRWRLVRRVRWWEAYVDPVPAVFGHYWRQPAGMPPSRHKVAAGVFDGYVEGDWLGAARRAFCADFSIGARFIERQQGVTAGFKSRLAAMRWPEAVLMMENGHSVQTQPDRAGGAKAFSA